jgi:osmotically-inducible protein OsmY
MSSPHSSPHRPHRRGRPPARAPVPAPAREREPAPPRNGPSPPPRRLDLRGSARPRILIVGEAHRTRRVRRALSGLPLEATETADLREAVDERLTPATAAVVLAPPLRGAVPEHAVSLALERSRNPRLHVLVIVPEGFPDSRSAWLYRRGASAVLAWSTDAELLNTLVEGVLGSSPARTGEPDGDRSLARMVRSRLRAARKLDDSLRLSVSRAAVRLAGRVRALWKRRYLEEHVSRMPGVVDVDASDLEVERSGRSDREIEASVRSLLRGASSIGDRRLAVSVRDGHVVLTGTVLNREEFLHARDLMARVEGVRGVANRTVEAPPRERPEGDLARSAPERPAS